MNGALRELRNGGEGIGREGREGSVALGFACDGATELCTMYE